MSTPAPTLPVLRGRPDDVGVLAELQGWSDAAPTTSERQQSSGIDRWSGQRRPATAGLSPSRRTRATPVRESSTDKATSAPQPCECQKSRGGDGDDVEDERPPNDTADDAALARADGRAAAGRGVHARRPG